MDAVLVNTVTVSRLHDNKVGIFRKIRGVQERSRRISQISGKVYFLALAVEVELGDGRTQDMSGIVKNGGYASAGWRIELDLLFIIGPSGKRSGFIEILQRI